jgi:hypothetical protein
MGAPFQNQIMNSVCVVVRDVGSGHTEVAAIDPIASMMAINNPALKAAAQTVREKLERAIAKL